MVARSTNHDWLQRVVEAPLEPELKICDPHHHLWDFRQGVVQPRYLLDEMLEDLASGHNVVSTVFIECGTMFKADGEEAFRPVGETEFVNGTAAMSASDQYGPTRIAKGIIGTVDVKIGDPSADVLDAQIAAAGGRFRGIRLGAFWHASDAIRNHRTDPPESMLLRDDFRTGFKHLAPRDLTFEAWCCHEQIPEVADLARAFPDTTIILDHFGGPLGIGPYAGKADEVFEDWRGKVTDLASCPNVMAKLGGLNMDVNGFGWETHESPPTSTELAEATRRYFDTTIELFGVGRCMFESNFPVDKLSCSYGVLWNSFKRLAAGYSADEKAALFHDTAARVYRL
ncbi:MAG: amidohydrolase family protein [Hyphomicrobiaceae bacterium]